jgi:deoxycytidylate deaminase
MTDAPPCAHPTLQPDSTTTLDERVAAYSTNVLPVDYTFDPSLSLDENYLVLTLIYARLSMSKRGNMACIIVDPSTTPESNGDDNDEPPAKRPRTSSPSSTTIPATSPFPSYPGRILMHSNNFPQPTSVSSESNPSKPPPKKGKTAALLRPNQSLFQAKASNAPELHAEARSICLAASQGVSLADSTAYVSFPPCQNCLPLLVASGVKRLVYRQVMVAQGSVELCRREGVERVEFTDKEHDERLKEKVGKWWKERGEGRDETRTRLERWWAEQERIVQGVVVGEAVGEVDSVEEKAVGEVETAAVVAQEV